MCGQGETEQRDHQGSVGPRMKGRGVRQGVWDPVGHWAAPDASISSTRTGQRENGHTHDHSGGFLARLICGVVVHSLWLAQLCARVFPGRRKTWKKNTQT